MTDTLKCGSKNCKEKIETNHAHLMRLPWYCLKHAPEDYKKSPEQLNPRSWWQCPRCGGKDVYEGVRPAAFGFGSKNDFDINGDDLEIGFARGFSGKIKLCKKCGEPARQYYRKPTDNEKAVDNAEAITFLKQNWWVFPFWAFLIFAGVYIFLG